MQPSDLFESEGKTKSIAPHLLPWKRAHKMKACYGEFLFYKRLLPNVCRIKTARTDT